MTELIGGIDYSKQRINDDALQSIDFNTRQGRDLNAFLHAYLRKGEEVTRPDITTYWNETGLHVPAGYEIIGTRTRAMFSYGACVTRCIIPTLADDGQDCYMGFEIGGGFRIPYLIAFRSGLRFRFGFGYAVSRVLDVTIHLPIDYDTIEHYYVVKINKSSGELYINDKLVAVILFGLPEPIPTWNNVAPYCLGGSTIGILGIRQNAMWEIWRPADKASLPFTFPIKNNYLNNFVVADGDPLPPKQFALFTENTTTKWNGLTTAAVVTSHPIPVWGYPRKTLLFQSSAAGTLAIQIYAGGAWREWASITLTANTLEVYNLNGEVPIMRAVYTPVGTDTITVAECMVAGD